MATQEKSVAPPQRSFLGAATIVEEYLGKDKKLYAAFMDLEKAYDRVDREAL